MPENAHKPEKPVLRPFGQDGILVRFSRTLSDEASRAAQSFAYACRSADLDGITGVEASLSSVLVTFDPAKNQRRSVEGELHSLMDNTSEMASGEGPSRIWTIPVCFDEQHAPQLSESASKVGETPENFVARVLDTELRVLAIGFAPGQPYIGMMPEKWNIARMGELNPQVPAGALVFALRQFVLFSNPSPTGWRHIGQTAFRPFLQTRTDPFLLRAGDGIRFEACGAGEMGRLIADNADGLGGARLENKP